MKVYRVREYYSGLYFSEVDGVLRIDGKDNSYVYDYKHAIRVLNDARKYYRNNRQVKSQLILEKVRIYDVPYNEYTLGTLSAEFFTCRKISFLAGLRHIRYEQVRKYNSYIDFDPNRIFMGSKYMTTV